MTSMVKHKSCPKSTFWKKVILSIFFLLSIFNNVSFAQCSVYAPPAYNALNGHEGIFYFVSGGPVGTTCTIPYTISSALSNYINDSTEGITGSIGSTIYIEVERWATYNAYISICIDWNNNGVYEASEMGSVVPAVSGPSWQFVTDSIVVPCDAVMNTNLHMRFMLSEMPDGAGMPCFQRYGTTYDFFFKAICPTVIMPSSEQFCLNHTAYLSDPNCGTWTSSDNSVAQVWAGQVTGISYGTATISYSSATCGSASTVVTIVGPTITPATSEVCIGNSITEVASISGGTWSVSNSSIATLGASYTSGSSSYQSVNGTTMGVTTITYTDPIYRCSDTESLAVVTTPTVSGPTHICQGGVVTYTAPTLPNLGVWQSSNTSVATVEPSSGVVHGVSPGTSSIFYYWFGGITCGGTGALTITVDSIYTTGASSVCVGFTDVLTPSVTGGTWTSSDPGLATVASGVVYANAPGTVDIYYVAPTAGGCRIAKSVQVNPIPQIYYNHPFCATTSIYLWPDYGSGLWASSNPSIASIDGGLVYGVAAGTATISFTRAGCLGVTVATVTPTPSLSWPTYNAICGGTPTAASSSYSGVWTCSNTGIATISGSGTSANIYPVSPGTTTIQCSVPGTGCAASSTVTVLLPSIYGGSSLICGGAPLSMSTNISSGTWSSSNPGVAVVSPSGLVTAVSVGTTTIFYNCGYCTVSRVVTVTGPSISGTTTICAGTTSTLHAAIGGGTWSTSNGHATVTSGGVVTGVSAGTLTISYVSGGCVGTTNMTIEPIPSISSSSTNVCAGAGGPVSLSGSPAGGFFSTSSTNVTLSGSTAYAASTGTATVTYTYAGCSASTTLHSYNVTVSGSPSLHICGSSTITLSPSAGAGGGTWNSSNTAVALVNSSGVVSYNNTPGAAIIYYHVAGCSIPTTISAGPQPTITGPNYYCNNSYTQYHTNVGSGTWSSDAGIPIDASTGLVSPVIGGTSEAAVTITYVANNCPAYKGVYVDPTPTTTLHNECTGGSACHRMATACPHVWGPWNFPATPNGGTYNSHNMNVTLDPDSPVGTANAHAQPMCPGWPDPNWHNGWVNYVKTYPDGNSCQIKWQMDDSP